MRPSAGMFSVAGTTPGPHRRLSSAMARHGQATAAPPAMCPSFFAFPVLGGLKIEMPRGVEGDALADKARTISGAPGGS